MIFCHRKIKEWNTNFTKLGEKRTGYRKDQVTVYMHGAAYHIPQMIEKNDNIKQFSGQGVEKNDDARHIIQRKSNHSDDPAEVLHTEYRLEALKHRERQHRKHTKRAQKHWDELIKAKRGKNGGISYSKTIMLSAVSQTKENVSKKGKKSKEKKENLRKRERNRTVMLRTEPTNSKVFLNDLLNVRGKQILTSVIEIQKENWG
ncbi:uncharacterized protein [Montipora capricornis]|uniref:uncharacterized protein isoform X2 n=1 Tax=Montipora capricornis TaxID=246305 RepID=UPI0035F15452